MTPRDGDRARQAVSERKVRENCIKVKEPKVSTHKY